MVCANERNMHLMAVIGMGMQTCGGSHVECKRVTQETAALWIRKADLMIEADANSD